MWNGYMTIARGLEGGRQAGIEAGIEDGRLSICGVIGHPAALAAGNCDTGGQCVEAIAEIPADKLVDGWDAEKLARLVAIWKRWHLNDMRPGCEHQMADGWAERPIDPSKPLNVYGRHFQDQRSDSWNMLAWVSREEHPAGLLGHPCPVCGYRYGTEWKREELPADVVAFIREL